MINNRLKYFWYLYLFKEKYFILHLHQVVPPINWLLDTVPFTMHCYSLDWHPADHISFIDNVHMRKLSYDSKVSSADRCALYDTVTFEEVEGRPKMDQVYSDYKYF